MGEDNQSWGSLARLSYCDNNQSLREVPRMARLWIYKCNVNHPNSGQWEKFFDNYKGTGRWGGADNIKDPSSRRILLKELQKGDLILAWQVDRQVALGLCKLTKRPTEDDDFDILLTAVQRFPAPIKLLQWKKKSKALARGKGFIPGRQGTLFETNSDEAREILRRCGVYRQTLTRPRPRLSPR